MKEKKYEPPSNELADLIGKAVQRFLEEKKIGKQEFSEQATIQNGYFSELMHGKKRWNTDNILKVAKALKIHPAELLGGVAVSREEARILSALRKDAALAERERSLEAQIKAARDAKGKFE